jgi:F0F1-type ATP synthase assembly protein I
MAISAGRSLILFFANRSRENMPDAYRKQIAAEAERRRSMMDRKTDSQSSKTSRVGVGIAMGLAIGSGVGTAVGVALHNIALGVSLGSGFGLAMGMAIGAGLGAQKKDKGK